MNDFLTDQKSALTAIRPPAWADADHMAATAVRRTRRRRTVVRATGGAVATLAVVGGAAWALPHDDGALPAAPSVAASPGSASTPTPSVVPDGWMAQEFGGLVFAVPADWNKGPAAELPSWHNDAVSEQMQLEAGTSYPDWTDQDPTAWEVPGAKRAQAYRFDDHLGKGINFAIERTDGVVYSGGIIASSGTELDGIVSRLRTALAVSPDAPGPDEMFGSTDDLPVVELPQGLPDDWRMQEIAGLELGVPKDWEGAPEGESSDGEVGGYWADASGDHEIWVTFWAEGHEILGASDRGSETFPLNGADHVSYATHVEDDGGTSESVVMARRADGGGTYQVRVVAPEDEGTELALQVAGTLALG